MDTKMYGILLWFIPVITFLAVGSPVEAFFNKKTSFIDNEDLQYQNCYPLLLGKTT